MFTIETMKGHDRMSTENLLRTIEAAVRRGETEFDIRASGQHDIGGPLWNPEGKTLHFHVTNAGQRVGSMCLPGTEIYVDESASADVGWLNSGGKIVVRGDSGDTTGHCASGGHIYIGGRAGTRSGSLMKHDPLYDPPQLWVLKNVGSFSFEFMGGGIAVVCGWDCEGISSVLGERSCVGMIGGVVYFRGPLKGHPADVKEEELTETDRTFLAQGMKNFLQEIRLGNLEDTLTVWTQWHKLVPLTYEEKMSQQVPQDVKGFRLHEWVKDGIFSDVATDDFRVHGMAETGVYRLRVPVWENAVFCAPCEAACPAGIPTQERLNLLRGGKREEALKLVLDYTPFPASVCGSVCPNPCMAACTRNQIDQAVQIGKLGLKSAYTKVAPAAEKTGRKIAVIGGGAAGLSAAWQLVRKGHTVTVYDSGDHIGGKMEQVIPRARLPEKILAAELQRIADAGVQMKTSFRVDKAGFLSIQKENDAVIVATGTHRPAALTCEGAGRAEDCLTYLSAVNRGERPHTGKEVIVIGAGDSAMDAARGAYDMGAEHVTCLARSVPRAMKKEIEHIRDLGGTILTGFTPLQITEEGVYSSDGRFVQGDMVISAIGEEPDLDYLPEELHIGKFRGKWLVVRRDSALCDGLFAAGDAVHPGRLADAIGAGARAAHFADAYVMGKQAEPYGKPAPIPYHRIHKEGFRRFLPSEIPEDAEKETDRCISCGTCRSCHVCIEACPKGAISETVQEDGTFTLAADPDLCIGCGICEGVCPSGIWKLIDNPEEIPMYRNYEKQPAGKKQ